MRRRIPRRHMIIFLVIFAFFCIILSASHGDQSFSVPDHLGTKRPYPITTPHADELIPPPQCTLSQLYLLARHGIRYPTKGDVNKFNELIELFKDVGDEESWWRHWRNPFKKFKAGLLAKTGETELYLLGRRTNSRYKKFLENATYDANLFDFDSSAISRSGQSGVAYSLGLFEGRGSLGQPLFQPVYIHTIPLNEDNQLAIKYDCPLWRSIQRNNTTRKREMSLYVSKHFPAIVDRISKELSISPPLRPIHAEYIHRACGFEIALYNKSDTWCSLLRHDEFKTIEYLGDIGNYYMYSYGNRLNRVMACRLVTNFVERVERAIETRNKGDEPWVRGVLRFAHAETIFFLTTLLGLNKDDEPLKANWTSNQISARQFRSSQIAPFAANFYFEIYTCDSSSTMIRMLRNEVPTIIPGCGELYCSWDVFKKTVRHSIDCDFKRICKHKKHRKHKVTENLVQWQLNQEEGINEA
ncbi:10843_t:CDS:2 [Paraglomus occultum]|uniref:Multiple inositol polyphosphate phosphatase 1 n=1 Tax=Paraglomus occultum TaxID=144539 RepID=A0A9N8VL20_9GLOM|nr:10843_t:CDS:2 [Paraglomus occultum]